MEEPPRGYRRHGDEPLFAQWSNDPSIVPDCVSPAVEGYFRIPAVWIGEQPDPATVQMLNPSVHHAVVLKRKLSCDIEVRVTRDGTFLFDFSSWPLAPLTVIPGYRIPDPQKPHCPPLDHTRAEEKAEAYAVLRAQVMNAHQACLTTAEAVVKGRSAMMGFAVSAWNTHKAINFATPPSYHDDAEDLHALAKNVLNNKDKIPRHQLLARRVLELEVIEQSLILLEGILATNDNVLIQMIEASYIAACRQREKRFGEAVILAWGVCEQLISLAWIKLLDDTKASQGTTNRMQKDRRDKLMSRDYTASVKVEMLEINGRIDYDLYRLLEVSRKARNYWAHQMRVPKQSEVHLSIRAVERLLEQVMGVHLSLQAGGRGGVPQWPVWMWEQSKNHEEA